MQCSAITFVGEPCQLVPRCLSAVLRGSRLAAAPGPSHADRHLPTTLQTMTRHRPNPRVGLTRCRAGSGRVAKVFPKPGRGKVNSTFIELKYPAAYSGGNDLACGPCERQSALVVAAFCKSRDIYTIHGGLPRAVGRKLT
jgi:hypothetical protein